MITISAIIPVYNASAYLRECLESLCRQKLTDMEFICINDGSTDDSLQILKEYAAKDKRIKIFSQQNKGLSATRNKGMVEAQGKYIGFVDADDRLSDDFFEKLYQAAEDCAADIAGAEIVHFHGQKMKKLQSFKTREITTDTTRKFVLFRIPKQNYVWNKIFRREFLINNQFLFKEGVYYEDILWLAPVVAKSKVVVVVPNTVYFYRYNENSIVNTTRGDIKKEQDLKAARRFIQEFIIQSGIDVELPYDRKVKFKIFGLPLFKVLEGARVKKYYFCGIRFMQAHIVQKS